MMNSPNEDACKKCGHWCCNKAIHTVSPDQPEEAREFYKARTNYWKIAKDGRMICYLEQPCANLGKNGCKIYAERPTTCREFPAVWNEWMEDYCELMRDKYND